jgi:phosphatidylserine decarboxylase
VTYSKQGEHVEQGQRMGLIRFGSRVDVFMPLDVQLRVKVGDMTLAGSTPIAELGKR